MAKAKAHKDVRPFEVAPQRPGDSKRAFNPFTTCFSTDMVFSPWILVAAEAFEIDHSDICNIGSIEFNDGLMIRMPLVTQQRVSIRNYQPNKQTPGACFANQVTANLYLLHLIDTALECQHATTELVAMLNGRIRHILNCDVVLQHLMPAPLH